MKWAPFREEAEKRIPLFARIPTFWPWIVAKPVLWSISAPKVDVF